MYILIYYKSILFRNFANISIDNMGGEYVVLFFLRRCNHRSHLQNSIQCVQRILHSFLQFDFSIHGSCLVELYMGLRLLEVMLGTQELFFSEEIITIMSEKCPCSLWDKMSNFYLFELLVVLVVELVNGHPTYNQIEITIIRMNLFTVQSMGGYFQERINTYLWLKTFMMVPYSISTHDCRTV